MWRRGRSFNLDVLQDSWIALLVQASADLELFIFVARAADIVGARSLALH